MTIAGFGTRIAAAALALFCVVAAFGFHFDLADQNFGAGAWSIDAWRRR